MGDSLYRHTGEQFWLRGRLIRGNLKVCDGLLFDLKDEAEDRSEAHIERVILTIFHDEAAELNGRAALPVIGQVPETKNYTRLTLTELFSLLGTDRQWAFGSAASSCSHSATSPGAKMTLVFSKWVTSPRRTSTVIALPAARIAPAIMAVGTSRLISRAVSRMRSGDACSEARYNCAPPFARPSEFTATVRECGVLLPAMSYDPAAAMNWLPRMSRGLTRAQVTLSAALVRRVLCVRSAKPWQQEGMVGKQMGQRV